MNGAIGAAPGGTVMQRIVELHGRGAHAEALGLCDVALAAVPADAALHNARGVVLRALGRPSDAVHAYVRSAALRPDGVDAYQNLSNALRDLAALDRSEQVLRALQRRGVLGPLGFHNLADTLFRRRAFDEAEACVLQALAAAPTLAPAWLTLGLVRHETHREEAAVTAYRRVIALMPGHVPVRPNIAVALREVGRLSEAERHFEAGLALAPGDPLLRYNHALLLLAMGRCEAGWEAYEWRWRVAGFPSVRRRSARPEWDGVARPGTTVLVWPEQGVGDEIIYASCIPDLVRSGQEAILECDRRLVPLFASSFPSARVRAVTHDSTGRERSTAPDYDYQVPIASLLRFYRRRLEDFPDRPAYLRPTSGATDRWRRRAEALGPGPKVGVSWRSLQMDGERARHFAPLADWAPVFQVPGVRFVNLQPDTTDEERAEIRRRFGVSLATWSDLDLRNDFDGVAGLCAALDHVVSGPSAIAFQAASVGCPVSVFVGARHHFRYLGTGRMPFHPTVRLFAKRRWSEPWGRVFAEIGVALAEAVSGRTRGGASARSVLDRIAALHARGAHAEALAACDAHLAAHPSDAGVHGARGVVLRALGRPRAAAHAYRRAIALAPMEPTAIENLSNVARDVSAYGFSERLLRGLQRRGVLGPRGLLNLADTLYHRRAFGAAEQCLQRVLGARPAMPEAWFSLGLVRYATHREEAAVLAYRRALALRPDHPPTWLNLGSALKQLHRLGPALASLEAGLRISPNDPTLRFNRALGLLAMGRLDEGWGEIEWRWGSLDFPGVRRRSDRPAWDGVARPDSTLLVWPEQGVGDQITFAGCVPDLLCLGQRVILECDPRLAPLFARSFPAARVRGTTHDEEGRETLAAPDYDMQCAIGSLPRFLRRRLEDFPEDGAFLEPDPDRVALWRARLARLGRGPKVGIAWRSINMAGDRTKYFPPLAAWRFVLGLPGATFVRLQHGARPQELDAFRAVHGVDLVAWPDLDLKDDFEAVAALIRSLDAVVTGPSSVMLLAGGLGAPTFVFHGPPSQYKLLGTRHMPWHPSCRLFVKARWGASWDPVMAALSQSLARHVGLIALASGDRCG